MHASIKTIAYSNEFIHRYFFFLISKHFVFLSHLYLNCWIKSITFYVLLAIVRHKLLLLLTSRNTKMQHFVEVRILCFSYTSVRNTPFISTCQYCLWEKGKLSSEKDCIHAWKCFYVKGFVTFEKFTNFCVFVS